MNSDYEVFDIDIGQANGPEYPIVALYSAAGEARAPLRLPFSDLALQNYLKDIEIALLRSSGNRRLVLPREEQTVQRFGAELFNALLTGEVRSRYDVSQADAHRQGKGLRIRLRIHSPVLAALPWEFLYDPREGEFICLSRNTPLVRYLELAKPVLPLRVAPPLRILGMIASPTDLQKLDVPVEKQRIEQAVNALRERQIVELHWLAGASWRDLQRAMRSGPWHVFHFIGHGGYDANRDEGLIAFTHPEGRAEFFTATDLGRLLADHQYLRLVLLNACEGARGGGNDVFSSTAATLVRRGIPAVVAMQYAISDYAAIEFAQTFYESLADNLPVDAAVTEARKAIAFSHSLEWGTPVLYMRSADGLIFNVQGISEQPASAPLGEAPPKISPPPVQDIPLPVVQPQITFDWASIPTGEFWMGSDKAQDPEAFDRELPLHPVHLPAYCIARLPVTVAQFARFVQATGYKTTAEQQGFAIVWLDGKGQKIEGAYWACPTGPQSDVRKKMQHPITCVSWYDALAFCAWAGVRLPTEAEWEKAARGSDRQIYPWGNQRPEKYRCNVNLLLGDTTEVGTYTDGDSPYGVKDMAGNVWEWTGSLYATYPYRAEDGREDAVAPGDRVMRGGSFAHPARQARCACRLREKPDYCSNVVGFRVVGLNP